VQLSIAPLCKEPPNITNLNKGSCFKIWNESCTIKIKHSTK
jgi:hypothetical protein